MEMLGQKSASSLNGLGRQMVSTNNNRKVLKHEVTVNCPGLFAKDRCHMSQVGNALFCNTLQGEKETFLSKDVKVFGP